MVHATLQKQSKDASENETYENGVVKKYDFE